MTFFTYFTAILYCHTVLLYCTAVLYCCTYFTAVAPGAGCRLLAGTNVLLYYFTTQVFQRAGKDVAVGKFPKGVGAKGERKHKKIKIQQKLANYSTWTRD
jgi:hypothetical protein